MKLATVELGLLVQWVESTRGRAHEDEPVSLHVLAQGFELRHPEMPSLLLEHSGPIVGAE